MFAGGKVGAKGNPDNAVPFGRLAAASHWSPGVVPDGAQALRETVFWTPPQLTAPEENDEINSSLCHGFIFDFCGVEVDRVTGAVRIDKYVTMHDCGTVLHPGMVAGQITGGFAHALGAALYEEFVYSDDGASSPARSPTIWCRPRRKCRSRSSCMSRRRRRSRRSAPRASAKAIA